MHILLFHRFNFSLDLYMSSIVFLNFLDLHTSNKLSGDANAAGLRTTLQGRRGTLLCFCLQREIVSSRDEGTFSCFLSFKNLYLWGEREGLGEKNVKIGEKSCHNWLDCKENQCP